VLAGYEVRLRELADEMVIARLRDRTRIRACQEERGRPGTFQPEALHILPVRHTAGHANDHCRSSRLLRSHTHCLFQRRNFKGRAIRRVRFESHSYRWLHCCELRSSNLDGCPKSDLLD
jgi:hypothetical protein